MVERLGWAVAQHTLDVFGDAGSVHDPFALDECNGVRMTEAFDEEVDQLIADDQGLVLGQVEKTGRQPFRASIASRIRARRRLAKVGSSPRQIRAAWLTEFISSKSVVISMAASKSAWSPTNTRLRSSGVVLLAAWTMARHRSVRR